MTDANSDSLHDAATAAQDVPKVAGAQGAQSTGDAPSGIGRRTLFTGMGAAAIAGAAGFAIARATAPSAHADSDAGNASPTPVPQAHAVAGITAPAVPQRHTRIIVLRADADDHRLSAALQRAASLSPLTPDTTTLLGVAPARAAALWPERVVRTEPLPAFRNDAADIETGGDVLVQICAESAADAAEHELDVLAAIGGEVVWRAGGFRDDPTPAGTARTGIGFIDGIINPRDAEMLDAGVWIGGTRDTYLVARRMHIEQAFLTQPVEKQEQAIGRRRADGAPLSGGAAMDQVDLFGKSEDGRLLTPTASHARRAHPSNIGRSLMLRRSYTLATAGEAGLLFLAFMNDPTTFALTQHRLDEQDDLIARTSTSAGGVFFVPEPGTI